MSIQCTVTFPRFPISPEEQAVPHSMASNFLGTYYFRNAHNPGPQVFQAVNGGLSSGLN